MTVLGHYHYYAELWTHSFGVSSDNGCHASGRFASDTVSDRWHEKDPTLYLKLSQNPRNTRISNSCHKR